MEIERVAAELVGALSPKRTTGASSMRGVGCERINSGASMLTGNTLRKPSRTNHWRRQKYHQAAMAIEFSKIQWPSRLPESKKKQNSVCNQQRAKAGPSTGDLCWLKCFCWLLTSSRTRASEVLVQAFAARDLSCSFRHGRRNTSNLRKRWSMPSSVLKTPQDVDGRRIQREALHKGVLGSMPDS